MSGYIGTQPVPQATQTRDSFTCTAGQTSFATSGYTPNFLDVYLNGVKLTATDYTASNGSDVVLASGAAAGDVLEVVAFTAFEATNVTGATDFTVTGSFTSQGIDDNATSTAMTLDTSGNLLVGKTVANTTTLGNTVYAGIVSATMSGDPAIFANRAQDGSIIELQKSGSSVGSIGTVGSGLLVGSTDSALYFHTDNNIYPYNPSASAYRNGDVDLGWSSGRFKDLYLSGGVYLGGVGSSNKLDDYEEGAWTPILDNVTVTYSAQNGTYTKIGNLVSARFEIGVASLDTTDPSGLRVGGLPFIVSDSGCLFTMDTENSSVITNKPNILGARPIVSASAVMLTQNNSVFTYNSGTASSGYLIGMVQYYA